MASNIQSLIHGYSRQKEEEQAKLIAAENHLPYINLVNYGLTGDVLEVIPQPVAQQYQIASFQRLGNTVRAATPYPHRPGLDQAMNRLGLEKDVQFTPYICSVSSINYALGRYAKLVKEVKAVEARAEAQTVSQFRSKLSSLKDLGGVVEGVSATEIFETLLSGGLAFDASDIHLEPGRDAVRVRFRIDGDLIEVATISPSAYLLLLSRIKNLAKLKLNRLAGAQDGRFSLNIEGSTLDVRVNVLPTSYGETVEMRLLTGRFFLNINQLGLDERTKEAIFRHLQDKNGLIILTGPTGSGKTTTLYAVLQLLNTPERKIVTIEDPVEYKISGIEQIQVDPASGFDFAQALRGVLRQDPDVILVGEIRDKETADIALNAALTGHLVLTTLHANSAPATFSRLIEMGVSPYLLVDAIRLIIAQKLVKKTCPACQGRGCQQCHQLGTKGRTAVSEWLEPNEQYAKLIRAKATISEFNEAYKKLGHRAVADNPKNESEQDPAKPAL